MISVNDSLDSLNINNDKIRKSEFIGKVKIILVDSPRKVYLRKRWSAAFIVLSQMLIGITNMIVLFYVLSFKSEFLTNLHIFLCTVGVGTFLFLSFVFQNLRPRLIVICTSQFQLCIPAGILGLNNLNGSSNPMSMGDKKFEHIFLETFGLICCILGTLAVVFDKSLVTEKGSHGFLGMVAGFLVILSAVTGLCTSGKGFLVGFMKNIHIVTGIAGFLTSSMCFVLGLYMPRFEKWAPAPSVISFLVIFCVLYSVVVTISSFRHVFKK